MEIYVFKQRRDFQSSCIKYQRSGVQIQLSIILSIDKSNGKEANYGLFYFDNRSKKSSLYTVWSMRKRRKFARLIIISSMKRVSQNTIKHDAIIDGMIRGTWNID